ncbi:hypothetical protein IW138_003112 [Coemansia sp. RSA 986]|nr:hypothetical protein IW138_003112 [Coemansia sp. RSA 986]
MVTTTAPDAVAPPSLAAPGTSTGVAPLLITAPETFAVVSPSTSSIAAPGTSANNVPASLAASVTPAADALGTSDDVALETAATDAFVSLDDETSSEPLLSELYELNQHTEEQLAMEKAAVDELLGELKMMATVADTLGNDLSLARANVAEVSSRADRAENLLHDQQKENKKQKHARIVSAIGVLHAECTLTQPKSEMSPSIRRDLAIVESYLKRTTHADFLDISISNKMDGRNILVPPMLPSPPLEELFSDSDTSDSNDYDLPTSSYDMPPQQSWMAEQEERLSRRRSSLLYADLIRPSACSSALPASEKALGKQPTY